MKFPVGLSDSGLVSAPTAESSGGVGMKVNVVVISDSYPGMEWRVNGVEIDLGAEGSSKGKGKEMERKVQVVSEGSQPVKE